MTYLTRVLDEIDQRRGFVRTPERAKCACCGDRYDADEFDATAYSHSDALERHYGGPCCVSCSDALKLCGGCGEPTGEADGYCSAACEARDIRETRAEMRFRAARIR